jgi:hypothetical protein
MDDTPQPEPGSLTDKTDVARRFVGDIVSFFNPTTDDLP